jgi:hypothetical protein
MHKNTITMAYGSASLAAIFLMNASLLNMICSAKTWYLLTRSSNKITHRETAENLSLALCGFDGVDINSFDGKNCPTENHFPQIG